MCKRETISCLLVLVLFALRTYIYIYIYIYIYFNVEEPKFGRFYLLRKINKSLQSVPGRPVISKSGFYTDNISAFLDFHLKPIAAKV